MSETAEFIRLIDKALLIAKDVRANAKSKEIKWMYDNSEIAVSQFSNIREQVSSGTLPLSNGAGLGITRALSEWAPKELCEAGKDIEGFFMKKWKK
jgi:hypothetical protein